MVTSSRAPDTRPTLSPNPLEEISHQGRDYFSDPPPEPKPEVRVAYMAPEAYKRFEEWIRATYPLTAGDPDKWVDAQYFRNSVEQKLIDRILGELRP